MSFIYDVGESAIYIYIEDSQGGVLKKNQIATRYATKNASNETDRQTEILQSQSVAIKGDSVAIN